MLPGTGRFRKNFVVILENFNKRLLFFERILFGNSNQGPLITDGRNCNEMWILSTADLPCCAVARVIEQCCFNSTPDPFNGQIANFILKPPKVIESRTYVKKANLECY